MGKKAEFPLNAALPGLVVGCICYLVGGVVGPRLGPGWGDVLQGSSFFVGLIVAVIGVRRAQRNAR
jgi:uncharacterized membrane protein YeaQ/YmgE (transglycosylase-associated protein family)